MKTVVYQSYRRDNVACDGVHVSTLDMEKACRQLLATGKI